MIIAKLEHNKKVSASKYQANYECLQARHSCKAHEGNEGKARYETLGKPRQKWVEFLQERHFRREYLSLGVPPLIGAQWMCGVRLTQGLRPGLCESIALTGLIYAFPINILYNFDALALYISAHRVGLYEKQKEPSPKRGRLFPTKNQPY